MPTDKSEQIISLANGAIQLLSGEVDSIHIANGIRKLHQILETVRGWQAHAESQTTCKDIIEEALSGPLPSCRCLCSFCKSGKHCKIYPCAHAESVAPYEVPSRLVESCPMYSYPHNCKNPNGYVKAESLSGDAPTSNQMNGDIETLHPLPHPTSREEGAQAPDLRPEIEKILSVAIDVRAPYAKVMIGKIVDLLAAGTGDAPHGKD